MKKIIPIFILTISLMTLFFLSQPSFSFAQSQTQDTKLVACTGAQDCNEKALFKTLDNVMKFILQFAVIISAAIIAYAGFTYLTAAGDTGKISSAHKMLTAAVVGFLIAISAWFIIDSILNALGARGLENLLSN